MATDIANVLNLLCIMTAQQRVLNSSWLQKIVDNFSQLLLTKASLSLSAFFNQTSKFLGNAMIKTIKNILTFKLYAVIAIAIALSVFIGYLQYKTNANDIKTQLDDMSNDFIRKFNLRFELYERGLRGARGAILAAGPNELTREQFRRYVASRNLVKEFPGASGFGFIRRVPETSLASFLTETQKQGLPDFRIRNLTSNTDELDELMVVQYIEPEVTNISALGLNMASDPVRRLAAIESEKNDSAILTGKLTLVQGNVAGILMMLPVFDVSENKTSIINGHETALGWVYIPMYLNAVMKGIEENGLISIQIDDITASHEVNNLYTANTSQTYQSGKISKQIEITNYGRTWRYQFSPTVKLVSALHHNSPVTVGLVALLLQLLVIAIASLLIENKKQNKLAHEDKVRLAAIVESSVDAIISKRIDGTVTSWNHAAELMFGYTRNEALGKTLASLIIPAEMFEEELRILGRLAMGQSIPHFETIRQRKDGTRIYVSAAVAPIRNERGEIVGASKTVIDITRQKEAENQIYKLNANLEAQVEERTADLNIALEAAKQASRSKAEFLANMSHEIRNPMNAVLGLAYLAEQQTKEPATLELIKKLTQAGRTLLGIINDILDFSKIEEGRLELESAEFSLSSVFDNISTIMGSTVGKKPIELVISPPPANIHYLKGDSLRLEQILINLISNAIKFTAQGHILVACRVLADEEDKLLLRFTVQDTGVGIAEEQQASIFQPFTQADTSITRKFGGTGLGLSICKQLVELMGGKIGLISSFGHGSEFWFTVNLEKSSNPSTSSPETSTLNVLIADDSDVALRALEQTSEQLGWKVDSVNNGSDAIIHMLENHNTPDVLIVDWKMPGKDGLDVARNIRELTPESKMPIVVMVTAYSREELLANKDSSMADVVLSKPVTASTLYDAVNTAMQKRGQTQSINHLANENQIRLAGLRLLVVDDTEINRELAKQIFTREGANVTLACDGKEAVTLIKKSPDAFDLILMDVQMPVMDGLEATKQIRQMELCKDLPIIALTAGAFTTQREAALSAGMNTVVTKPYDVNKIVQTILDLTEQSEVKTQPNINEQLLDTTTQPKQMIGIDYEKGLEIWGDKSIYHRYLRRFAEDYQSFCTSIESMNTEQADQATHKLKGAASSLGLSQLAISAGHLNSRFHSNDSFETELRCLRTDLDNALALIANLTDDASKNSEENTPVNQSTDLDAILDQIKLALDLDNPNYILPLINQLDSYELGPTSPRLE